MSTFLWLLLVVLYFVALVVLGMATLRKGHTVLFWVGFILPVLWIVGALMQPIGRLADHAALASHNEGEARTSSKSS